MLGRGGKATSLRATTGDSSPVARARNIPAMARRQPAVQGARPGIARRKVDAGTRATTTAPQLAWAVCGHSFSSRPPPLLEHVGYMNVTDDVGRADHTAQVTNGQPVPYLWRRHVPTHFSLQVNLRTFATAKFVGSTAKFFSASLSARANARAADDRAIQPIQLWRD